MSGFGFFSADFCHFFWRETRIKLNQVSSNVRCAMTSESPTTQQTVLSIPVSSFSFLHPLLCFFSNIQQTIMLVNPNPNKKLFSRVWYFVSVINELNSYTFQKLTVLNTTVSRLPRKCICMAVQLANVDSGGGGVVRGKLSGCVFPLTLDTLCSLGWAAGQTRHSRLANRQTWATRCCSWGCASQ